MSSIATAPKNVVSSIVRLLNQPVVKEGVKNIVGSVTFTFGLIEANDIYQTLKKNEIVIEKNLDWIKTANKVSIACAKTSLILSAAVSRPGVFIISKVVGSVFSSAQLEYLFGRNTIFAINPWHPRHSLSIAAVILALPSATLAVYQIALESGTVQNDFQQQFRLTKIKIQLMTLFNTITSRPTLHIGNQLGRFIVRYA